MARSYAALYHRIWADPTWRALDVDAQHLYLLLISQDNLNLAGVLPLQVRKWSKCVHGWDEMVVADALHRLRGDHFVVVDDDTEEVLVRTFVRNSGAYKTPGMLTSILKFAESVQSFGLRRVLAVELGKLEPLEGKTAAKGSAAIEVTRSILDPSSGPTKPGGEPIPDGIGDGIGDAFVGTHRGCLPQNPSDGIADTSITSTGTGTGPLVSLADYREGKSTPPPDEPPLCAKHEGWDRDAIPGCRACQRLRENWEMARAEAAKPNPLPPLCGECDNRWIETERGMARCPNCNPAAERSA
ncbi:MAG: hypothetical protein JWO67_2240 [Streptosporangiaceae bacterium]|nr:hypothetical protein [Streptosporangiaceae bacterium]